jgi:hypothetical protein
MSNENNIFELASRQKTRINTARGSVSTESLWDMTLTGKSGVDLDSVGQAILVELDGLKTRSLVTTRTNPRVPELELQLALIKHVIAVKQEENTARLAKAEKITKRNTLIDLLAKKQTEALGALSEEEIKKQLAALDD